MGCTVREKHLRSSHRKPRSMKTNNNTDSSNLLPAERFGIPTPLPELTLRQSDHHLGAGATAADDGEQNRNPNPNFEEMGWGYCTEAQLEQLLLKNLECLYSEAVSKLLALGYDEDIALKAVLRNGHCYGSMDVLSNILHNSLAYLDSNNVNVNSEEPESVVFRDMKQLQHYSLTGMISLLRQVRPHLTKGDAMWCLLMSDLHVGRASTMEVPQSPVNGANAAAGSGDNVNNSLAGVAPGMCRFHGGWGFGGGGGGGGEPCEFNGSFSSSFDATLVRDIECPKRFNLPPSLKNMLQRNVTMFAAGFRANAKPPMIPLAFPGSFSTGESPMGLTLGPEVSSEMYDESRESQSSDVVSSVMSSLGNLSLDEKLEGGPADQKNEMILNLIHQVKDLEMQVKERKEWAHQKAMQAARKLSHDLTELKMLRMEREETQRLKKGKQALEDTTMKRLSEMENALRKASGQVDRANAAVRRLETENAEIRAEMEASKLSASESVTTCLEVAKREKKCLKKLLAWEKQRTKLQEEVAVEKQKIAQLQQQLLQIKEDQKETEVKWRQEIKDKELAITQVEDERRSKEATEASAKRKQESLRRKIEIDFQRHKDDVQRMEQELSRLRASAESNNLHSLTNALSTGESEMARSHADTNAMMLHELNKMQDSSDKEMDCDRECLICLKDEISVVFLPCAHQVLCASCNDEYGKKGKANCPCCQVQIEQRIRVYGASS